MSGEPVILRDQPVLDLSHLTSPEQLAAIGGIEDVALIVVPESLAAAFLSIPTSDVAATVYVPEGSNVRVHAGMLAVSGDGLGGPDDVLIVAGLLVVTSPVTGPLPRRIHVAGGMLAPRGSEAALGAAMTGSTGGVSYYKYAEGQDVRMLSGEVRLSGAGLENQAGKPEDILLVAGEVVVTGQVSTVGYSLVVIAGEVAAPEGSRGVLEAKLQVNGEVAWYPGNEARVFRGKTKLGASFFRQLDEPATIVSFGRLSILPDVTESMLREKVRGFTLFGKTTAPDEIIGVVQFLATDVFGSIGADDGPGD